MTDADGLIGESLSRDFVKISDWCDLWGMKLKASKIKTMIVLKYRTIHPQSPPFTIGRTVPKESDDLVILGVTFDSKIIFEIIFPRFPKQLLKGLVS